MLGYVSRSDFEIDEETGDVSPVPGAERIFQISKRNKLNFSSMMVIISLGKERLSRLF